MDKTAIDPEVSVRERQLIKILNGMIERCQPIKYQDFNIKIPALDEGLEEFEKEYPEVGLANIPGSVGNHKLGITTISIIATITDVLTDKRLAVTIDDNDGTIVGFQWYKER